MAQTRIIIAGGGTGGHIFPAVAIGHALQRLRPGTELLFVGAEGKMEMEKIPQAGFRITGLDIAGFNRSHLLKNIALPWKILKSYLQARRVIRHFRPHAVVGVGGYASFPVLFAAQRSRIPTLIQEQNSYAGKSNKILARKATAVCVAYPSMERFFPAGKLLLTGNPVREPISKSQVSQKDAHSWLNMDPRKKTLLIVGGSLGARSVNESIASGIPRLLQAGMQLLWQTGKLFYPEAERIAALHPGKIRAVEFIREMEYAYAAADIVVSRAGALAISELCIAGKPVVFVPYPYAAEDHQTSNARALSDSGAACMVADGEAGEKLVNTVLELLRDPVSLQRMAEHIEKFAVRDADERIASKTLEIADSNSINGY